MPCWEPIETRFDKRNRMFHSSAFAIAAGVVAVGAAATSAAVSMSAADKAAKAQGAAGKKYMKERRSVSEEFVAKQNKLRKQIRKIDPTLDIPEYNLQNATTEGIAAANRVTENTLQQLEKIAPGSAQARQQAGQIIGSYMRGEVPQDVQEQITRMTAERMGAGFRPPTGGAMGPSGFQTAQGELSRSLGLTSLQLQQYGMGASQSWQQLATGFIKDPGQMMQLALQGRGQDIDVAQMNIQNRMRQAEMIGQINQGQYAALMGDTEAGYGVSQRGIESTLASRQAVASGVQSIGSATAGALMGVGGAYGQLGAAQAGGTTYGSVGAVQAAAPYAAGATQIGANSYVPRAQPVY